MVMYIVAMAIVRSCAIADLYHAQLDYSQVKYWVVCFRCHTVYVLHSII